jgi:hypothetical protein
MLESENPVLSPQGPFGQILRPDLLQVSKLQALGFIPRNSHHATRPEGTQMVKRHAATPINYQKEEIVSRFWHEEDGLGSWR